MKTTIIPAEPGWRALCLDDGTGSLFGGDPVIAWEVQQWPYARPHRDEPDYFVSVAPITISGRYGDRYSFLLRPDGVVEEQDTQEWATLEEANSPAECLKRLPKKREVSK